MFALCHKRTSACTRHILGGIVVRSGHFAPNPSCQLMIGCGREQVPFTDAKMLLLNEAKLEKRTLARHELLFRQGDKVQAIYFIEEGRLRLDRRTFDGRSLVFGTSSAGEFFVEAALFAGLFPWGAVGA